MCKYLDALRAQNNSETRYQRPDIADLGTINDPRSVMSVPYLSVLKKNNAIDAEVTETKNKPASPLEDLQLDKDIELLPGDRRWLARLLLGTTLHRRRELLEEYKRQWLDGMDKAALAHQRQNTGRKQANTWIRMDVT